MHVLDNPVWHALAGPQRDLGSTTKLSARFNPEIAPFGALGGGPVTDATWEDLAQLLGPGGTVSLTGDPPDPPKGWKVIARFAGLQMVASDVEAWPLSYGQISEPELADWSGELSLGLADAPEMLALVDVAQPGPFLPRTVEFGGYLGIRRDGRLVAMAGERLRPPGYVEISAVATDPDHRRLGYARQLVVAVASAIIRGGEIPFLHASAANAGAVYLYESLGFTYRRDAVFLLLEAPS